MARLLGAALAFCGAAAPTASQADSGHQEMDADLHHDVDLVDASTLTHKFMMGYQGWFATPCDGFGMGWSHWSANNRTPGPDPGHQGFLRFDSWPDMTEFDADELCPTGLRYPNGSSAGLYSAANSKTVARHFRWMASHGIDGVWKQRFLHDVNGGALDSLGCPSPNFIDGAGQDAVTAG